jgi:methylated-DNA-[protein]-cysteine S-methyltransferase
MEKSALDSCAHRVIGTNGSLTGYAGGLYVKKWLLEHENPTTQQSLF